MSLSVEYIREMRALGATRIKDGDFEIEFAPAPQALVVPGRFAMDGEIPDFSPPEEINDPDEDMRQLALYSAR